MSAANIDVFIYTYNNRETTVCISSGSPIEDTVANVVATLLALPLIEGTIHLHIWQKVEQKLKPPSETGVVKAKVLKGSDPWNAKA